MSHGWKTCTLGDILTLKRGYDLPASKRVHGNIPVYASSGVNGLHNEAKVKGPGVVTGRSGTLGEVFYVEEDFWPLNTTLYVQDFKGNNARYISYLLESLDLSQLNAGSGVPTLNRNDVHPLEVTVPNIEIQTQIADMLGSLEDKIKINLRMNETLEQMTMALYKHWFVDFRPFQDGEFEESELGMIPKGWKVGEITDICDTSSGGTPSRKKPEYYQEGTINWLKTKELDDNFIFSTEEKITELGLKNSSAKLFPEGTVIMAMYGATVGKLGILGCASSTNQACCALIPRDAAFPSEYIYTTLLHNRDEIIKLANGGAQQNISQQLIRTFPIVIPPENILKKVNPILQQYLQLKRANEKENMYLMQSRDYLLPRLLSGKIDLGEAEKQVEEVL